MSSNLNLDKIYLNINFFVECTEAEGPGKRFCIWLQGCNLGCKNCINEEMLGFEAKKIISIQDMQNYILLSKNKYNIEGITFLGGEPFLQANNLKLIAEYCQHINLSVMSFSGFKYKQLIKNVLPGSSELLSYLDVLIDGKYIESLKDSTRNWVGSTNQKFYYLTSCYNVNIENDKRYKNKLEINIQNNMLTINGEANLLKELKVEN